MIKRKKFNIAFFSIFFILHHISLTVKDFSKIPTVTETRDPQLKAEILSQKITLICEFRKNINNEKYIIGFKSLTVREKKKLKVECDIFR
jgi:hypothetical protein